MVRRALAEDLGWGDVTTASVVPPDARATGIIVCRGGGTVAGLDAAIEAFRQLDPGVSIEVRRPDGSVCRGGDTVAHVAGLGSAMLMAERTAMNLLGHLSGIATATRHLVDLAAGRFEIADTRRTLPLLRALEQYAVRVGGGTNGRFTLDEGIVLETGHVRLVGGVGAAVARARAARPDLPVEVEVTTLEEVDAAVAAGATVLTMRQASLADVRAAVSRCAHAARVRVAGRWGPDTLSDIADSGVRLLAIDGLIDSAGALDVSLDVSPA